MPMEHQLSKLKNVLLVAGDVVGTTWRGFKDLEVGLHQNDYITRLQNA
eukprot:CAMPEP_0183472608 /NCGR_PEP_ID=MMETSP0370-20130417/159797_1 /TAXON_ID=268820 /ORGANISM="Peridinium aciculiferum, Strain PAER-2" /LENGTH=47 /DNA_ID= /DNA_START= /DNA_END= /DNA_ORIENTATION=